MTLRLAILLAGAALDRLVGDPDWLWRRAPHPVVLIGRAIEALDLRLNDARRSEATRRRNGVVAAAALVVGAALIGLALTALFRLAGPLGWLLEASVVAVFLARKSLIQHVAGVELALEREGLAAGRRAVALIVGRDTATLDAAGIRRAAIESLAENASDGIVAPCLWYLALGLPGLLAYKAINTADSMIGHMNPRYRAFGRAAAKLDDWVNWPAARLTALLIALAAGLRRRDAAATRATLSIARRDAPLHRSPNAGWPEAAMAAALGLSLGGPRRYRDLVVDAPALNPEGRRATGATDVAAALTTFGVAIDLLMALIALLFVLTLL